MKGLEKRLDKLERNVIKRDLHLAKVEGKIDSMDVCLQSLEGRVRELEKGRQRSISPCLPPSPGRKWK